MIQPIRLYLALEFKLNLCLDPGRNLANNNPDWPLAIPRSPGDANPPEHAAYSRPGPTADAASSTGGRALFPERGVSRLN